jgi:hypothetical protein
VVRACCAVDLDLDLDIAVTGSDQPGGLPRVTVFERTACLDVVDVLAGRNRGRASADSGAVTVFSSSFLALAPCRAAGCRTVVGPGPSGHSG